MNTRLSIDTSHSDVISVILSAHGKRYERTVASRMAKAQTVLPLTAELIRESGISLNDIDEISVAQGQESLTGVRVGYAIANILGKLLGVPVNGKKTLAIPRYKRVHYKTVDRRK